ncbi:MAG: aspartate-semialdehyde dehydrogenase [Bacteroidales bacterium]|jgi:aspartate-semialdehyde dehydrogenase|nr:aspartate-semialdehyde dehydrogenase [Bacteroidales bacterium]NPV35492.1 aspartate-semialdehyde dehydrogenase [Bacteroidales bacterium]
MPKISVVGATGLVGRRMIEKVIHSPIFKSWQLIAVASERSAGKEIRIEDRILKVVTPTEGIQEKPDIALFSAGAEASGILAPRFAQHGFVIDNSSYWRLFPEIPLVVPEINAHTLTPSTRIIANPNCSTIQMVLALSGLHRKLGIRRIVVSTYQSVTGSGQKGIAQLEAEEKGQSVENPAYPHPIYRNLIPHGGYFLENGYTSEEMKLVHETRKILGDNDIAVTATVVRVAVKGGHSEAVNVEFKNDFTLEEVITILRNTPGVEVLDDPRQNLYPMPLYAEGKDEVFVGRIRRDESQARTLNLWIVSDNLLKGAATNAVQIAEHLVNSGFIS